MSPQRPPAYSSLNTAKAISHAARTFFGVLLFAACVAGLGSTFWLFGQSSPPTQIEGLGGNAASAVATARDTERLAQEAANLRDEAAKLREESVRLQAALDGERREADGFRWLLTAIVGLGALYGLFQGLYSYFNVQGFNSQADRIIKDLDGRKEDAKKELEEFQKRVQTRSETDFDKFRKECEARFPLFIGLEAALSRTASLLANRFGTTGVAADLYRPIDELGREEIYYYERSAAALEYMGFTRGIDHIRILRGFSSFYLEKHRADSDDAAKPGRPPADPRDLMLARFYLDRAHNLYGANFRISNAFGALALRSKIPDLDHAKTHFEESLALEPHQQNARYALAYIALEKAAPHKDKHLFQEAVDQLRAACKEANWEDYPISARIPAISYNLACATCRVAEFLPAGKERDDLLKEAFEALGKWALDAPAEHKFFDDDRKPKGELAILVADNEYRQRMEELAASITRMPAIAK